jgi:hypothetical protein
MPIDQSKVRVDGIYSAGNNQHRKVVRIESGNVYRESRSGNLQNDWAPGHTLASPTPVAKFAEDCTGIISLPS